MTSGSSAGRPAPPSKPGGKKWWGISIGIVVLLLLVAAAWVIGQRYTGRPASATAGTFTGPAERAVREIALLGPLAQDSAEISGLGWYSDTLILLPQYPQRMSPSLNGAIYGLPRSQLEAVIDGQITSPLEPVEIPVDSGGFEAQIAGFEGYEAIAFQGEQVYLTIEARQGKRMMGYVVRGQMQAGLKTLRLDPASLVENPPQADQDNHTDEALLVTQDRILTFFESNGQWLNPAPHATVFDLQLQRLDPMPLPPLEYRLTDAAGPDSQGRFWVINYFYPGDKELKPAQKPGQPSGLDPLAAEYGQGASHARSEAVERLVEFQITPQGIVRTGTAPVQLQLSDDGKARNWEGLALLPGKGFFMATDKSPHTILGFVAYP